MSGEHMACVPGCTQNSQCPALGVCDTLDGLCKLGETDCSDGEDDEGDDRVDCADSDCAATCRPLVDAACADAAPETTTTIEGDTSLGTRVFEGRCGGVGPEDVHLFTPPAGQSGTLRVVLQSGRDHALYARTACADGSTELACKDATAPSSAGPEKEEIAIVVRKDQEVPIFVDAVTSAGGGPYTLDLSFSPATCGDGTVSRPEECDDGNTTNGDGCSAECTAELDDLCADAPVAILGANPGDTTAGTMVFEGTCTGTGTRERIHAFTPPSDGTLRLALSSATDQGFYVRTGCRGPERACIEAAIAGDDERTDIAVDGGVPLFIFVEAYRSRDTGPYTLNLSFMPAR
jgi:cysteine-rich repeat protein